MIQDFWELFVPVAPWALVILTLATVFLAIILALYENTKTYKEQQLKHGKVSYRDVKRIAILIASKDGEKTIGQTVKAAVSNGRKVFVVSDGSTDGTVAEAKKAGATVLELRKNVGKPTALYTAYQHFKLGRRYDAIAILDDDVLIEPNFIHHVQKSMGKNVAITVGKNITDWPDSRRWNIWLAVRAYSYWCYQITLRRIQSGLNVMNCISGSNSLYRTEVLNQVLSGTTPYIVDDTYWTLETHRLQLGKIVYSPRAHAWIQDPTNFRDWYKQNLRWMWGTFQGVIGHKIGTEYNKFHMAYVILLSEWILYVVSAPLVIWLIFQGGLEHLPRQLAILMAGYSLWVVGAAIALKKPRLMIFLPAIIIVDFIFRGLMVHALVKAFRQQKVESCVWESPKRIDNRSAAA